MLEARVREWEEEYRELGRRAGLKEGRQKGIQEGYKKGLREGLQEGRKEGEAALLLRLLERKFGRIHPATRKKVQRADAELLLDWGERLLTAERLEDVFGS